MKHGETYNGYGNRETWAVALWLNNDEGFYRDTIDMTEDQVRAYVEDLHGYLMDGEGVTQELRNMFDDIGSLLRVNWAEVAESVKSE